MSHSSMNVVAEELRSLATRGDEQAFLALAQRSVGLERAQELVRRGERTRPGPSALLAETGAPPMATGRPARRRAAAHLSSVSPVVEVDRWAYESMRGEIDGGYESGGFLIGERSAATIRIVEATGPGPEANRGPRHVYLSWTHGEAVLEKHRARGRDVEIVGAWHTHPDGSHTRPSARDIANIGDALDRVSAPWIEIINAFKDDWSPSCEWSGWSVYRDHDSRLVCKPAHVEIGEPWR